MSWSTIVATSAAEFDFWHSINDSPSFHGAVIYFAIPLVLVCINAFSIEVCLSEASSREDLPP